MNARNLERRDVDVILDGTKIDWYCNRVRDWDMGMRIAPITIDMALTTACNMDCVFCYHRLQYNERHRITKEHITAFLQDCAAIGVKGVSLVSDGESTISPLYCYTIAYGHSLGIAMASATNGYLLGGGVLEEVLPYLTYLRFNISAGEQDRYNEIMGAKGDMFYTVCDNIRNAVAIRDTIRGGCTIGMQMVFMPQFKDQLLPLAHLALEFGVDYLVIKHCSDDEFHTLGVDYGSYEDCYKELARAEALATDRTSIKVKWSKIKECSAKGAIRSYKRCYGTPFLLQISGTGLVAPCGMLFNERYKDYHMGNITSERFIDIWRSNRYWEIIYRLASEEFDAQRMCGSLCLQHSVNKWLDRFKKGEIELIEPEGEKPPHLEFV